MAAEIGICVRTLMARVADGSLPAPIRLGRRVLFNRAEVLAALQKLKGPPTLDGAPRELKQPQGA
jgi:predicted DNA-binding transcriptional regulator AlpA